MEDTLWGSITQGISWITVVVLILVLMEDTLWVVAQLRDDENASLS